jgi:hypothetical protein
MVNPLGSRNQYKNTDKQDEWQGLAPSGTPITLELPHGARVCETGMQLLDLGIDIDQWSVIGLKLCEMHSGVQWAIGDWWAHGYRSYGERAHKAVEKLPYTRESLMNLGTVARRVPPSLRNEALSFSHHVAVAPLEHEDQEKWLRKAAGLKWSVKKLRDGLARRLADQTAQKGFDPAAWARNVINCAQRPNLLVEPANELEVIKLLSDAQLNELAEAATNAREKWNNCAKVALQQQKERARRAQRPKRERFVIPRFDQAAE